ncbi:M36 family metallopeptidase [Prosthecobacter sp.]|uniref:M36 family metallopeptidase n=1 Tax=Prosthecobacter sp. TaxID=1965333 RepID=UPI002ABA2928|nr:M36 family metallopeptidase [Prosthecobacter sp.]MDZ4405532.1 M36 family metallopeptidase [Prosthecobacter sp.]
MAEAAKPAKKSLFILDRKKERLGEMDKRESKAVTTTSVERAEALAALRREVPGVQVDFDPITGAPSHIMAAGRFLAKAQPDVKDPHAPVRVFVTKHAALFGHGAAALQSGNARVTREDVTAHSGMRTVVWQQEVAGVPVFQTILKANLTKNGDLVTLGSHFMGDPVKAAGEQVKLVPQPPLNVADAMTHVAKSLGGDLQQAAVTPNSTVQGAEQAQKLTAPGFSDTAAHLSWVPIDEDTLRLAWEIETFSLQQNEMFRLLIDAEDGKILVRQSLTADISNASYRVFTGDSPTPMTPGHNTPLSTQPAEVARSLVTTQALNTTASPEGWIPDGQNETVGNNVDAHLDLNADNIADTPRPQGSPSRVFDFSFNSASEPTAYRDATVTQLFYYNNWIHDRMYQLGFTESAGNFQTNNFGRGGNGNDAVQADAQDGSGTNNANFSTPSDGSPGRMQMYIWPGPAPDRDSSFDGDIVVHEYGHGISNRLVGGGVGISAWQSRGMGEGWSDFYAMSLQSEATDNVNGVYPMAGYSTYLLSGMTTNYYHGLRRYPYCTDMTKAPLTYKDIDPTQASPHTGISLSPRYGSSNGDPSQYHAQGEVWCNMLMECRANIITARGWAVGNELMLRIVTDGLKLTPANPTFIQARDAIIQADLVNNAGTNANYLWAGFAKRGMGASASGPVNSTTTGVVEAYDIPDDLQVSPATPFVATGVLGGPFAPASRAITLNNIGTAALNWTASASQPWLLLSRTAGSLAGGANDSITASFSAAANNLAPGSYSAMIDFTNTTSGAVIQRQVSLTVDPLRVTILAEPFDAPTLSGAWTVTGTGPFRTQVTAANAPRASNHLTMDSSIDTTYARNEATLTVNLAGQNNVELVFWAKGFGEDSHGPPTSPFINGADFDGVAISADGGTTWYEVQGLRSLSSSWTKYTVDLDAAVAARGLNYTSSFKIRFNQYDNYGISTDGIAIDDILIAQSISNNLALSLPVQAVTEGASDVTATLNVTPTPTSALTVTLSASTADVLLPATVTVPANTSQITIPVTIVDDALLDGSQTVVLTATAAAFPAGTAALTVHDNETAVLTVDAPLNGIEGSSSLTGTVSVPVAVDAAVTITLESSNPAAVVTATVVIPAGQSSTQFFITLTNDGLINGTRSATFTASVNGWTTGSDTLSMLDDENANLVLSMTVPAINETDGLRAGAGRISVNGFTQSNVVISLASNDTSELTVPASVTLPAGATQVSFDMTAVNDPDPDGPQNVIITASAPGFIDGTLVTAVNDDEAAPAAWNPRPSHLSTNNPVTADLAWSTSEGNLIANGGFESGLNGWSFNVPGGPMFKLQNGSLDPSGNDTPTPPYAGTSSMIFAPGNSSGTWSMWQDVAVPPDGPAPVLQWMQRIRNTGTAYSSTQQYRVEIRDPSTDTVLTTAYTTAPGDALFQDWAARSADLSAWRGRNVRIAFVVASGSAILNVLLDEVTLQQRPVSSTYDVYFGTNPAPGPAELLGNTATTSWTLSDLTLDTTYYWQVVTKNGAQIIPGAVWQFSVPAAGNVASFAWGGIASPQNSSTDIPVTVTALDALGHVAAGFTGTANLSAVLPPVTQPSVLITEHSTWTTDEFEFTNVTNAPVDVSGWKVLLTQFNSFPAPYLTFTIPNGTTVAAGGIFRVMESGTAPGAYPLFRTGLPLQQSMATSSFVILKNARDEVVDFVCVGGDPRRVTVPLPVEAWNGSSLPTVTTNPASMTYQRTGSRDNNSGADWQLLAATPGTQNAGLTPPFTAGTSAPAVTPQTTASFTAGVWSGSMQVLGAAQNLRLRASENGGKFGESGQFIVNAPNGQLTLTAGATAAEGAGTLANFGTVSMPAAVATDTTVSFLVNSYTQAGVANVTIPAGAISAGFDLSIVDDALVEGTHSITITAIAPGCAASAPSTISITDNEGVVLTLTAPESVTEGQTVQNITITSASAPLSTLIITLASSDTTEATLPATVTLPAGQTSVTANLTVVNDTLLDGPQTVTLTASAAGFISGTANVTVNDNEPAVITLAAPATIAENAGVVPAAGTVTLGGQAVADTIITLSSSDTSSLTVPATVTVLAGQSSATFAITAVDDSTVEANAPVTLTASLEGLTSGTMNVSVRDDELAVFAFATISSPQKAATAFPVTISARNTSGDAVSGFTGTALLTAAENTITPGATTAFTAGSWTGNVTLNNSSAAQTITTASGAATGTSNTFVVDAGALASFALSPVSSPQEANTPLTLTATAKDALDQTLTTYTGPARLVQLGAAQTVMVGSFAGSTTTNLPLLTSGYNRERSVILVRASELGTAGMLSSMSLHFLSPPPALTRFMIRLKPTALTAVSSASAWDNSGWQTVYDAPLNVGSPGWVDFAFSSSFPFDGNSNVLMEIIHSNTANSNWSPSLTAINAAYTCVAYAAVSSSSTVNADPTLWTSTTPSKSSSATRPLLRFNSRTIRDASPATLTSFASGVFSGPVSAPYGGTGQTLGVWDMAANVLTETSSFNVTSAALRGVAGITGTVTANAAPAADLTVNLTAMDAADVTLPASVTILAGSNTATFAVTTVDDPLIEPTETVTVTAAGAGYDAGGGSFTITDNDGATLTVTLPASVTEGGASDTGTVTASSAPLYPVTINLTATPSGLVTVPASVTLPAGQTSVTFSVSAVNNTAIDGTRNATVTASTSGWTNGSATVDVLDNETLNLALSLSTTTPREGAGTISGTVALSGTTSSAMTVNLTSDDTSEATVPATVTIPAGASSAGFTLTIVDDALTDGTQPVTLTASALDFTNGTLALQVLDNDVAGFASATVPNPQIRNAPFSITVNAVDVNGALIPGFAGTVALSAANGVGAIAMTPATSGSFVNGTWTGNVTATQAGTGVVITADGGGGLTGMSNSFDVLAAGSMTQFAVSTISSPQMSGTEVPLTITAQDAAGNTITGYNGNVSFSAAGPSGADVVTGTGTFTTTTVLGSTSHDSRNQSIFTPAEVGAARTLRSMAFEVVTLPDRVLSNFTLRLKHTTKTDYSAAGSGVFETTGWTTVYQANQSLVSGWNTFTFPNGFSYDGVSNLMVDISYDNPAAGTISGTVRYTSAAASKALYATSSSTNGDPLTWNGSTSPLSSSTTTRLNLRFSGHTPVTVTPAASGSFAGGVWNGSVTFASSGPSVMLKAVNGAGIQGQSGSFTLNGSVPDHFEFASIASPQTVGTAVPVTVTAKDANNMPVTGFTGPAVLSGAEQALKAQVGTGSNTTSTPLGSQNKAQRMQVIYTAAELGAARRTLTGLDLNATTAPGSTLTGFTIRVKHTTKADFTAAGTAVWESTGWTTVFQSDVTIPAAGWTSFPFTTPFEYDGSRNVMVDFSYNNAATGTVQGFVQYTTAAANRTILRQTNADEGSPLAWHEWSAPVPTASTAVPNARFSSSSTVSITPVVTDGFTQGVWSGSVTVNQPKPGVQLTANTAGFSGTSHAFNVNPLGALSITLAAAAEEGAAPLTGTITRTGATTDALTVDLASSDTTEAEVVMTSVSIPSGAASADFTVNVIDDAIADGPQNAVITASAANYTASTATVSVTDNEALTLAVSLPANLSESTTAPGNAYVTINQPAASALTVTLSSNDTTELTVPASVTIAAGATSATFAMTVVNDTLIDGPQPVTATATAAGYATGSASTTVQDNETLSYTLNSSAAGESAVPYSVTLTLGGTTSVDVPVTLSVNDTSELLLAPNTSTAGGNSVTVTVPANSSITTLAFVPQDDAVKDGNQSVTLTLSAPGYPTLTRFVSVVDDEVDRYFFGPVSSPQTANASFSVSVTARNIDDSIISTNNQTLSLAAANAAGTIAMTPASVTLVNGTGTFNALFTASAADVNITATDAQNVTAQSAAFDVLGTGGLSRFDWSALSGPQLVESPVTATVTAKDAASNTLASYTGPANLKAFNTTADLTIGAGTLSWSTPLGSSAHARTQSLYLQSEMGAARRLTGLALNILTSSSTVLNNFTIRMKHSSATSFSSTTWDSSGWTTVFSGTRTFNTTGWQNTVFTRPFDYDGVSNVMVDVSFGNTATGTASTCQYTTAAATRSLSLNTSTTSSGLPTTWGSSPLGSLTTNLLNVRFTNATPLVVSSTSSVQNTSGTGTVTANFPLGTFYHDERSQMIYTPAEVGGAMTINSVALDVSTIPGQVMNTFTIRMKHTATADYNSSASWDSTGWTTVYSTTQTVSTTGWNTFTLTTPFVYNGSSNLMVDICFNNSNYTSEGYCRSSTTTTPRSIWYQTDSGYGDPLLWSGTTTPTPITSTNLPNMRFSGTGSVQTAAISPTATGSFANGSWTGGIAVQQAGASVFLAADDPATGISGYSNAIAFNSSGALALTFLGTLAEGNGTVANGGTLTLPAAPVSAVTVSLGNANSAQMTVPATVTVPAGQTSVSVPVTIIDDSVIEGTQTVAVTAVAPGYTRVTTSASIADNDGGTFTLTTPASVAEGSSSFTATLNASATSPVTVTVSLSSNDTTELTVPATVTLPANASSVNFTVTVVNDTLVDGPQNAVITASASGWTSGTATVSVTDNDALPALSIYTYGLSEGGTYSSNYVYISTAPASAVTVSLSSDSSFLTVPATVTVSAGSNYGYFTATAPEDSVSTGTRYATVSASAASYRPAGTIVAVADNDVSAYRISTISGTPVAGAPVSVTITAIAADGGTVTAYTGTVNLSATGSSGVVPVTPAISGSFSSGVWTGNVAFNQVTTGIVLTATDALSRTGSSNAFNTTHSTLDHFTWAAVPSPQAASTPFSATVTAKDFYENIVADYAGPATLQAAKDYTTATAGTGTSSDWYPFGGYYPQNRCQMIYTAAVVGASARKLQGLAFDMTTPSASYPAVTLTNLIIRLKHTSLTSTSSWDSTGWTTVFQGTVNMNKTGWREFVFSTPFDYNGTNNLMVDISSNKAGFHNRIEARYTFSGGSALYGFTSGNLPPDTWSGSTPLGTSSSQMPNLRLISYSPINLSPQQASPFTTGAWSGQLSYGASGSNVVAIATDTSSGSRGVTNTVSVTTTGILTLTMAPTATEGTAPLTATVGIASAPAADLAVTLNSTNTAAATVPATITIPAGQTSVTFPVTVVDDALLDGTQSAVITASVMGYDAGVSTLSVLDDETTTITLSLPATLAENAAATTGTVTLSTAAGSDVTLPLTSSDTTELGVPASVTIPAGSTSATFPITPVDDSFIDFAQNVTVSASMAGWTGGSTAISITDNETTVLSLSFTSSVAEGSGTLTATLTSSNPVQDATTVTLASADTTEATVPATATIAAGSSSTTFAITIINDTGKDGLQTFAITAAASGFTAGTRNLTVTDNDVHNFLISAIGATQIRNAPFNVTFTARDVNNVTITNYSGTPSLSAMDGATSLVVTPASLSGFSGGVKTQGISIGSFATNAVITVTDAAAAASSNSNAFGVTYGIHTKFGFSTIASPQTTTVPFSTTIVAQDAQGNTVPTYTGTATLAVPNLVSLGTAGTTFSSPLDTYYDDVRTQVIYTAAEAGAARNITSIALDVTSLPPVAMSNFTIRMRHITKSDYGSGGVSWESGGWTTCHQSNQTLSSTGWNTFTFTTPFAYNGVQNVMVDISFNNASSSYATGGYVRATTGSLARTMYYSGAAVGDPLAWTGTSPWYYTTTTRPDIRFGAASTIIPSPTGTGSFTAGVWTGNVTIPSAASNIQLQAAGGALSGLSNTFSVIPPLTLGVTLPASAAESAGSVSGTVTISAAQGAATTVNLASNDTTEASPTTATVTIPAGSTSVGFTLSLMDDTLKDGTQSVTITASAAGAASGETNISITDDDVHNFLVSTVGGTQVRNAPFNVTFTARDVNNVTITGYNGSPVLTASDGGTSLAASPGTISGFSSGVKSQPVTVGSFASNAVLTLTDPVTGGSGSSNAFAVTVGAMSRFAWDTISPPQVANDAFPVTITAQDAVGNTVTSYSGSAALYAPLSTSTRTIGTGSVTDLAIPFNTLFTKCRSQQVHLSSEIGVTEGPITSVALNVTAAPTAVTFTDFTIRLKHTARTGYSLNLNDLIWETDGFTTVYQGNITVSTTGYRTFTFTTPFTYDGVSNLMVDYSYRVASPTTLNRPTVYGTDRGSRRSINYYTSTTTYGEPLTWSGITPPAFGDSRIADIQLGMTTYHPLSPATTSAFTNGVWTGNLTLGSTADSVTVTATDAALTGTSNSFEVIPTAFVLTAEPAFTGGLANTLAWNLPAAGLEYELERSATPDFAAPVSSGFLVGSTTTFGGLVDGQTYHYRARMRRQGVQPWTSAWFPTTSSTQDASPPVLSIPDLTTANASATLTGTATDATSGVSTVTVAGNAATTANAFANWTRNVTGLVDGSNSITVTASDNAVPPNTANVTAIVYRITTPAGDPNNNGINSLVEHALGIPAGAPNAHSMLPAATVQTDSGTNAKYLSMQFRRRIQRSGLAYTVETSTNLTNWDDTGASVQEMSIAPTGDGVTETVTVRVTPAMSASNTKGYVRLRIATY